MVPFAVPFAALARYWWHVRPPPPGRGESGSVDRAPNVLREGLIGWCSMGCYSEFVHQATEGLITPFPYQARIAEQGFPRLCRAPTGAGKTMAVTLGWLWRRRYHPDAEVRRQTPRRLVYCLPMRTLVEQVRDCARAWIGRLGLTEDVPIYTLMGGDMDRDWDRCPEQEAVLVGTQDQLLSRALNRGYTMSRYRWPVQCGLLNSDCLWVLDEVQLMGPGLPTSVQLQAFRDALGTWGACQSMWMSATLDPAAMRTVDSPRWPEPLTLAPSDWASPSLAKRLQARKNLAALDLRAGARGYARDLATEITRLHRPDSLTLVIQNTVRRAQETAAQLRASRQAGAEIVLLHSSFRPPDRERAVARITAELGAEGRIVVATQAVEAGVDLSAHTLITELAPWPSFVQRCGRCNRGGEFPDADVVWVDVGAKEAPPYEADHLALARDTLGQLDEVGIATLETVKDRTPAPQHPVIRRPDVLDLFDTTPDLSGQDVDISPYIREADDHDVGVFWREVAAEPLGAPPAPHPAELCPVSKSRLAKVLERLDYGDARVWDALDSQWSPVNARQLRAGMAIMLPTTAGAYDAELGWWEGAKAPVPALVPPTCPEQPEGYDANRLSDGPVTATIAEHTDPVVTAVGSLRAALADALDLPSEDWETLVRAARWHDAGKAHPEFQSRLARAPGAEGEPLAKGPYDRAGATRRHFRHELASALAALAHGESFLLAYLVAAHHGKVRLSLRSLPEEDMPVDPSARFARGVWDGDVLPEARLGGGVRLQTTILDLSCMEMGLSDSGERSWLERALELLHLYGPFRLAYLEALLRVADWRASAEGIGGTDG